MSNEIITTPTNSNKTWQRQLAEAFSSIETLCHYLQLPMENLPVSTDAMKSFPLRVPLSFASRMQKANPDDPLLRQVLPVTQELLADPNFSDDPVGDLAASNQHGYLHKYYGRVLLINTGSCAIHCRYCFRRNFPYTELQLSKQRENIAIQAIKNDITLTEVILSGGDPLLLNDERLAQLIQQLDGISHIERIRIHTRLPIVLPARITESLLTLFKNTHKPLILVIHCNHPHEISPEVTTACLALKNAGVTLFNQSVLLRGINDDAAILCKLSEQLFNMGVIPYYLHLLDKVTGTVHFEVATQQALTIIEKIQATLPGYLVPKLVKEIPGAAGKQLVTDSNSSPNCSVL